jgi:hypothetical protein
MPRVIKHNEQYIEPALRRRRKIHAISATLLSDLATAIKENYPSVDVARLELLEDVYFDDMCTYVSSVLDSLIGEKSLATQKVSINLNSFLSDDDLVTYGADNDSGDCIKPTD